MHIGLCRGGRGPGIAGFVCYVLLGNTVEIASIAVAPEARRTGLGKALVEYALAQSRKQGCQRRNRGWEVATAAAGV